MVYSESETMKEGVQQSPRRTSTSTRKQERARSAKAKRASSLALPTEGAASDSLLNSSLDIDNELIHHEKELTMEEQNEMSGHTANIEDEDETEFGEEEQNASIAAQTPDSGRRSPAGSSHDSHSTSERSVETPKETSCSVPPDLMNALSLSYEETSTQNMVAPEPPRSPDDIVNKKSEESLDWDANTAIVANNTNTKPLPPTPKTSNKMPAQPVLMDDSDKVQVKPRMQAPKQPRKQPTNKPRKKTARQIRMQKKNRIQNERRQELDALLVMYGVNPSSVDQSALPGPFPDWDEKSYPPTKPDSDDDISLDDLTDGTWSMSASSLNSSKMSMSNSSNGSSKSSRKSSVRFLIDPNIQMMDEEGAKLPEESKAARMEQRKKKHPMPRRSSDAGTRQQQQQRTDLLQRSSSEPVLNNKKTTTEQEWMMEAQRSLSSLSPEAMADLMKIVAKKGSSTDMKQLMKDTPQGSFIVESEKGVYHSLDPKTLMEFVATRSTNQRKHVVGNVTVLKEIEEEEEEEETEDGSISLRDLRDKVIYEV